MQESAMNNDISTLDALWLYECRMEVQAGSDLTWCCTEVTYHMHPLYRGDLSHCTTCTRVTFHSVPHAFTV